MIEYAMNTTGMTPKEIEAAHRWFAAVDAAKGKAKA